MEKSRDLDQAFGLNLQPLGWFLASLTSAVVGLACCSFAAHAQSATGPVPDASLSTHVSAASIPDGRKFVIDGGQFNGPASNPQQTLFHSFQSFDLNARDVAFWTLSPTQIGQYDTSRVDTIINRVTGGRQSIIDGTLDTSVFPNADLMLINPAGVIFGPNFTLSVPQGLYVSTANELRFANGDRFLASTASGSTLSISSPQSFGFLGGQSGNVTFDGSFSPNNSAKPLDFFGTDALAHFSAANILFNNEGLAINNAMVRLAAVGTAPENVFLDPAASLAGLKGDVTIINAGLDFGGQLGAVASNPDVLKIGAGVFALVANDFAPVPVQLRSFAGGGISVESGSINVEGAAIQVSGGTRPISGDIRLLASEINLKQARLNSFNSGNVANGNIVLSGQDIRISSSSITSDALGLSPGAGSILINATRALRVDTALPDGTALGSTRIATGNSSSAFQTRAGSGAIRLTGSTVDLLGARQRAETDNSLVGRVQIEAATSSGQNGGDINVAAKTRLILEFADMIGFSANPEAGGVAAGSAGNVAVTAADISLKNSYVAAASSSAGNAGNISMTAARGFTLSGDSQISATSSGSGNSGAITLAFGSQLHVAAGSRVSTDLSGSAGSAGNINLVGPQGTLVVEGNGPNGEGGILSSASGAASGGNIVVNASGVKLLNGGIRASAINGTGGQITINTNDFVMREGAFIATNSENGVAGDIRISVPDNAILFFSGDQVVPRIVTTSRQQSGGRIFISRPFAIISRGSAIEALGPDRNASANIDADFRILGFDRPNAFDVAGSVFIQGQSGDVSRGTQNERPQFLDAYRVLVGRCAQLSSTSMVSGLAITLAPPSCER